MPVRAAAFLSGVLAAFYWPTAPYAWLALAAVFAVVALRRRGFRLAFGLCCAAVLWGHWHVRAALAERIVQRVDARIHGCLVSAVYADGERLRFQLRLDEISGSDASALVVMSWYDARRVPEPGECWSFRARLSPPRGLINPTGFDYEKAAFARGIAGHGYVLGEADHWRTAAAGYSAPLLRLRLRAAARLRFLLGERPALGVVVALTVGLRDGIAPYQWEFFSATGTSHLIAISGLHIGLIAGFGLLVGRWLPWPGTHASGARRRDAALLSSWLCAAVYAALAGFALPTRRALVMLSVFVAAGLSRRRFASMDVLACALLVVLLVDPFAVLSAGLWMSFASVAALLILASAGSTQPLVAQLALFFALAPIMAAWTGRISLLAPIANLVCVPLYSLAVIPVTLVGAALAWIDAGLAKAVLAVAATLIEMASSWLAAMASFEFATLGLPARPLWMVLLALLAALLLVVPDITLRLVAGVMFLPLLFGEPARLGHGAFRVTVLDVGQGLALVLETRRHVVIYDTGDRWRKSDAGRTVIAPELAAMGVDRLLALIISHSDKDHRGGARALLEATPATWLFSGEPLGQFGIASEPCRRGSGWRVDGVLFEFLHPDASAFWAGNNASCVLRVTGPGGRALITGDLEILGEVALVHADVDLRAAVVVGQHHGSSTSSSAGFISASGARHVVFSTGFTNRWGLPAHEVAERWRLAGGDVIDTARSGAVVFTFDPDEGLQPAWRARAGRGAVWRLE